MITETSEAGTTLIKLANKPLERSLIERATGLRLEILIEVRARLRRSERLRLEKEIQRR
jgi:hypothetical protein